MGNTVEHFHMQDKKAHMLDEDVLVMKFDSEKRLVIKISFDCLVYLEAKCILIQF